MKIRCVGGPADGRELDWNGASTFLIVPVGDRTAPPFCGCVWVAEAAPMAVIDPDAPDTDEPYYPCPDGKYRQTSFVEHVYRVMKTGGGSVFYQHDGTQKRIRKVYDPVKKVFEQETIQATEPDDVT